MNTRTAEVVWDGEAYIVTLRDSGIIMREQEFVTLAVDAGDFMMAWVKDRRVIY